MSVCVCVCIRVCSRAGVGGSLSTDGRFAPRKTTHTCWKVSEINSAPTKYCAVAGTGAPDGEDDVGTGQKLVGEAGDGGYFVVYVSGETPSFPVKEGTVVEDRSKNGKRTRSVT